MRRFVGLVCGITLILSACSGADPESTVATLNETAETVVDSVDNDSSATTSTAVVVPTTLPRGTRVEFSIDSDSGELIESEVEVPGPATYTDVVDLGIEAGLWDEAEGLTRVLGYAVGAVAVEQVPGAGEVLTGELNALLDRANSLALSGAYSDDELADLRRWYELAVPTDDVIAMLVGAASGDSAAGASGLEVDVAAGSIAVLANNTAITPSFRNLSVSQAPGSCAPVDADDFSGWAVVEGCYEKLEDVVEGVTLQVLYPSWYLDDPTLANLPLLAREALAKSVSTYSSLGEIGDMTVVFSLVDTAESDGTLAVATVNSLWGVATVAGACPITIFPAANTGEGKFQQTVAHETWHCVQHYSGFPQGVASGTSWYHEGGAEYFSNVVYPSVNDEHSWLSTFDSDSAIEPLSSLTYDAWVWWQYLANRQSPRAVADLHLQMKQAGGNGISVLSGYGLIFQRFTVEYVAGVIEDANGVKLPQSRQITRPPDKVAKNDTGKVLEFVVQPFVAARYYIEYEKELRVFESDQTSTDGEVAMVEAAKRGDPEGWKQVFPEVRSKCQNKTYYVLVATTEQGTHKAKVQVDRIEEASCDPCVLGTWDLDLNTFEDLFRSRAAASGGLPPGVTLDITGHYYSSLNDEGVMREQRVGLDVSMGIDGNTISFIVDSFARGTYSADGERLSLTGLGEIYSNVTVSVPTFGDVGPTLDSRMFGDSIGAGGGSGIYECSTDELLLTIDGQASLRFDRVDKILEPDPAQLGS